MMRHPRAVARTTGALLIIVLFLLPVLYVLMLAFESPAHFLRSPLVPPASPDLSNFGQAWSGANLAQELINTIIYSVVAAGISTALALLIAFPIARRLIRRSSALYNFLVIGLFLPFAIIPLFIEAHWLHLWDNPIGYIMLHVVEPGLPSLPLGVLLLTAFISSVPIELDEAAWMDGAGYLHYLTRVVVPLTRPALLIAFLYGMLNVWNDIIGPVALLATSSLFPVTRGIYNFYGSNQSQWTILAAGIVIVSLPLVLLFAVSQRQLIKAAVAGSVKG
jgi:raffinose/stachyose/melibiose transport system permease protein